MPEMVALLNGFGGGASVFVAGAALLSGGDLSDADPLQLSVATVLSGLIGSVTFFGSLVAFAKLREMKIVKGLRFAGQQVVNAVLLLVAIGCAVPIVSDPTGAAAGWYWAVVAAAALLGVLVVVPIGGADMPVVICLLNSYSGIAASMTGFALGNNGLIISGSLVGASGLILTNIMCKAMNRSMTNVLFGVMAAGEQADADSVYAGKVKSTSPEEVAMLFDGVRRVVIVPGYGLAVSQAQHVVRDLTNLLESRGATVEFGIHPVAGRMPGHMNVLLAEADIPYDKLIEMDDINPSMAETDVCIVIGANDVVNPLARTDPKSPIAGMPIIDVDKARTVVVVKRSLSPGFAGIPNPLFAADNTLMLFGDGKKAMMELVAAVKES
jgi:NAD(P) transhydrogenase subunit beta